MEIPQILKDAMSLNVKNRFMFYKEKKQLKSLDRAQCSADNLRHRTSISLSDILQSSEIKCRWLDVEKELSQFTIPDNTGGVNLGDRRAIFHLISGIKPRSVLEIGTHIGASTIHIAIAIKQYGNNRGKVTTVDIVDVNSRIEEPWLSYGATHSPEEMIDLLGCRSLTDFVVASSIDFANDCNSTFDFIFLDGDHSASTVYQEIPIALKLLNENGVILLHDYFPNLKPLWTDGSVVPGPYLAVDRHRKEGVQVAALPLAELPWPTKLNSNRTSLALLLKDSEQRVLWS